MSRVVWITGLSAVGKTTLATAFAKYLHGVARVVHTSTSEVYGTAQYTPIDEKHPLHGQSPYSASKIGADKMAEAYARSFDLPTVILRPFNTYGPRQSERAVIPTIIRQCLDSSCAAIRIGDLSTTRDFNYVSDTVEAFAAVGLAEKLEYGTAYNTGTGMAVSIGDIVEMVRRLTNTSKPVEKEAMRIRPEHSEVRVLLADSRRLTEATGWRPCISLEDGLSRTIAWWRGRFQEGHVRRSSAYLT